MERFILGVVTHVEGETRERRASIIYWHNYVASISARTSFIVFSKMKLRDGPDVDGDATYGVRIAEGESYAGA